jgi:hypothetical protein
LVALREQPLAARLAAVAARDRLERPCDVGERIVPRDLDELVVAAA